ncbi:MAG: pyridoxal phosphate-dependent aminotransferase [Patescibacteria group bacterium]
MMKPIRPFSRRITQIEVSAIKQMALKAMEYQNVVSFGWGVPSFRTKEEIRDAVREAFAHEPDLDKYAPVPGLASLREKIARTWPKRYGFEISPKEVLVSAGAMEAMMGLMMVLFDPGDEVLVMDPGFASHIEEMEVTGLVPSYVHLDEAKGWGLTEQALLGVITEKSKGIILINPNNPTGHVYTREDIELLAHTAQRHNLWLIVDEPYEYLVFDGKKLFHPLMVPEARNHVITVQSFSKKYAMTGWRVGYFVGPEELVREFMKFHDNTIVSAPRISQIAALSALDLPDDAFTEELEEMHRRRDLICYLLDEMPDLFSYVRPAGSYYIFPKIIAPRLDDVTLSSRLLEEVQVVTTPGSAFGPRAKNHLRLTFCGTQEEISEGMKRIKKWWEMEKTKRG